MRHLTALITLASWTLAPAFVEAQTPGIPVFFVPIHDAGKSIHLDYGVGLKDASELDVFQVRASVGSDRLRGTGAAAWMIVAGGTNVPGFMANAAFSLFPEKLVLVDLLGGVGFVPFDYGTNTLKQIDIPVGVAIGPNARTPFNGISNVHLWLAPRAHARYQDLSAGLSSASGWELGWGAGFGLGVTFPAGVELHAVTEYLRIKSAASDAVENEWSVGFSVGWRS